MVFLPKGSNVYKLRLARTPRPTLSTGCVTKRDADDVERVVNGWLGRRGKRFARPDVITALADKTLTLTHAYDADMGGTLDAVMDRLAAAASVVDLAVHVTDWHAEKAKAKRGAKSANAYRFQLRRLYPATAPFTLSEFTRKEVNARLDALIVDGPTKNRYKAAVASFAKYLVKRDILETNFVRDIEGFGENEPRLVYYERKDAKKLIAAMAQPFAGIAAFACGFCAEWVAIKTLIVGDIDVTTGQERALVRGTKTPGRWRWLPLVEENRWVLPYIEAACKGKLPGALVFEGITETRALRYQQRVAKATKVVAVGEDRFKQHRIHDWRHTHTVQLLRDGYHETIAGAHLGDKDTTMVRKVYGRFVPGKEDYARKYSASGDRSSDRASQNTSHGTS